MGSTSSEIVDDDGGKDLDNHNCDFDRTDAEEKRLIDWAEGTILTAESIKQALSVSRENLSDVGKLTIKYFCRLMRFKLLELMKKQDLDSVEPSDEELRREEGVFPPIKVPAVKNEIGRIKVTKVHTETEEDDPNFTHIPQCLRDNVKNWFQKFGEKVTGLDARIVGAFTIAKLDKENRIRALDINDYLQLVECRIPQTDMAPEVDRNLPVEWQEDLRGIDFTQSELQTLWYFSVHSIIFGEDAKGKVSPEEIFFAAQEDKFDTFECPLCIRTLQQKLENTRLVFKLQSKHGIKHRFPGKQGQRVEWIRLVFNNNAS